MRPGDDPLSYDLLAKKRVDVGQDFGVNELDDLGSIFSVRHRVDMDFILLVHLK